MDISDVLIGFKDNEPLCLYCNHKLAFMKHISNNYNLEYLCHNCNEGVTVVYTKRNVIGFLCFSFETREIVIHFFSDTFRIESAGGKKTGWFPYFKFDFSDKEKLKNKINTYLTFS